MKNVKVEISGSSLYDIFEKVCKTYRQELFEADNKLDIQYALESLKDVMRLWDAVDAFDIDNDLILTIEKREEQG